MKEERYRYKNKCENCNNFFYTYTARKMFCCETCAKEYFNKKYPKQND